MSGANGNGLPHDAQQRKQYPIATGFLDYFPRAIVAVAGASVAGNGQHQLGPLHWDRSKSPDEADSLMRHFMARGTIDTDGHRHSAKMAWRAMALLEKELEAAEIKPVPMTIGRIDVHGCVGCDPEQRSHNLGCPAGVAR